MSNVLYSVIMICILISESGFVKIVTVIYFVVKHISRLNVMVIHTEGMKRIDDDKCFCFKIAVFLRIETLSFKFIESRMTDEF